MRMLSYAQNGEDVLLDRALRDVTHGFYVDIGANDPVFHSVTKHFYEQGWSGINVEPQPSVHARLVADRPRDVNLNLGVSDHEGELTFFEAPTLDGWSTFTKEHADVVRRKGHQMHERVVPVTTLAALLATHADRPIDFLKIDVEMHEVQVMRGADWKRFRPRVLLIESNGWETWEPPLLQAGYHYATCDGLNRYYVRDEDQHRIALLAQPVSVLDEAVPYGFHHRIELLEQRVQLLDAHIAKQDEYIRNLENQNQALLAAKSAATAETRNAAG